MRFAIAGCQHGHIKMFIDEMLELGHVFTGIYDDGGYFLAESYAKEYGVELVDSKDKLLEKNVDIIGNAARNDEKIDIIEWAETHGMHVMTDKPVCVDAEGLDRLKAVIRRNKIRNGIMLTERFSPPIYTLKQLIDAGMLGDIYDMTFLKPHKLNRAQRPGWFFDRKKNGGLIVDIMIHDLDLIHWFTGKEIISHQGMLVQNMEQMANDFYDNAQVSLVLDGNTTALLKADWLMPEAFDSWGDGRIFVTGSKGRAEIRTAGEIPGDNKQYLSLSTYIRPAKRIELEAAPVGLCEDFLNKIAGKECLLTDEAILRCHETAVSIDIEAKLLR